MTTSSGLDLQEEGEDFVLVVESADGNVTRTRLRADQVLTLAQSAPLFRERALERFHPSTGGVSAVFETPVVEIELNTDLLGERVLLTMITSNGARQTYGLTPYTANLLVQRLPERILKLLSNPPNRA